MQRNSLLTRPQRETSAAAAPAGAATATPTTPRRADIVSGVVDAAIDVRRACNAIKRTAALSSATMVSGLNAHDAIEASHRMAMSVLRAIGFSTDDESRVESVMPMLLEATSLVLADAARHAPGGVFGAKELASAEALGVSALSEIAKSRVVAKMVEPSWPADIDATTALRLSAASAMAQVAVEVANFDYMHPAADCIREAGKVVVKAAMEASAAMAPARTSAAARLTLAQSLVNSAAKLYAAAWRSVAAEKTADLDALSQAALDARLDVMEKEPLATLLEPVNKRFSAAYSAVVTAAVAMFPGPGATPAPTPAPAAARAPRFRGNR